MGYGGCGCGLKLVLPIIHDFTLPTMHGWGTIGSRHGSQLLEASVPVGVSGSNDVN